MSWDETKDVHILRTLEAAPSDIYSPACSIPVQRTTGYKKKVSVNIHTAALTRARKINFLDFFTAVCFIICVGGFCVWIHFVTAAPNLDPGLLRVRASRGLNLAEHLPPQAFLRTLAGTVNDPAWKSTLIPWRDLTADLWNWTNDWLTPESSQRACVTHKPGYFYKSVREH